MLKFIVQVSVSQIIGQSYGKVMAGAADLQLAIVCYVVKYGFSYTAVDSDANPQKSLRVQRLIAVRSSRVELLSLAATVPSQYRSKARRESDKKRKLNKVAEHSTITDIDVDARDEKDCVDADTDGDNDDARCDDDDLESDDDVVKPDDDLESRIDDIVADLGGRAGAVTAPEDDVPSDDEATDESQNRDPIESIASINVDDVVAAWLSRAKCNLECMRTWWTSRHDQVGAENEVSLARHLLIEHSFAEQSGSGSQLHR